VTGPLNPEDIQFPVTCFFKVIAVDRPGMQSDLEKVFLEVNIRVRFEKGHYSANEKYIAYNAEVVIHSLELMRYIDRALRAIDGVKLVL
jgi:putative lipoic acid-binding regulatory protein